MKGLLGLKAPEMGAIFSEWNAGALGSFLIEITADILKQKDPMTKKPFRSDEGPPRPEGSRDGGHLLRVECRRARQFSDRNHRRHSQAEGPDDEETLPIG